MVRKIDNLIVHKFITTKTAKELGRVNVPKDFWDCYSGQR